MKRWTLLVAVSFVMSTAMAQDNPYIVKTKGVQREASANSQKDSEEAEPTDFMGKNFRYYSMCDWKEGMRFMVVPEKYDLLVNTFHDAATNKEVGNGQLRHLIMVYKGHSMLSNGRVHINFTCEDNGRDYYFEQPYGTFEDYCYSKAGVPTLAYLGDVDKARELLMNQPLLTRTQHFRVDTEYYGDGYRDVVVEKNMLVTVKAIGVGTRSFPVKIIVEDENGNQFYQNVAMSKTNSGIREEGFSYDAEMYSFAGSFEFLGANMTVSSNIREYLNKTVHTKYVTSMSSKGSGKVRDVKVPRFTGFIIDEITPVRNSKYYTLTMRETDSRRVYYKDVVFNEDDIAGGASGARDDFFGYLFGLGEKKSSWQWVNLSRLCTIKRVVRFGSMPVLTMSSSMYGSMRRAMSPRLRPVKHQMTCLLPRVRANARLRVVAVMMVSHRKAVLHRWNRWLQVNSHERA